MDYIATIMEDETRMKTLWMFSIAHSAFIFGWYFFYTFLDCFPGLFNQYRIQPNKVTANMLARTIMRTGLCGQYSKEYVERELALHQEKPFFKAEVSTYFKSAAYAIFQHVFTAPAVWVLVLYGYMSNKWLQSNPDMELTDFVQTSGLPAVGLVLLHLLFFAICEDTMFYWGHRLLHTGPMYRAIHKIHHEHHRPISLGAEYAHPLESVIGNIGPFLLGPMLLSEFSGTGCHMIELVLWFAVRMTETAEAHSGYHIPFISIYSMFPWSGALMHDFHHSHNQGAYGTFFRFWDSVCGTDKQYNAFRAKEKAAKDLLKSE